MLTVSHTLEPVSSSSVDRVDTTEATGTMGTEL
jgi:hypothetical protein